MHSRAGQANTEEICEARDCRAKVMRCFDIASLTLANETHLDDFLTGYGDDGDVDMIRAWWSWRCRVVVRWLAENGYGSSDEFPEVAVLHALAR